MADEASGGAKKSSKKKAGGAKGGRFAGRKKMEKRRGTGIVVLDDDDAGAEPSAETGQDGLGGIAEEEDAAAPAAEAASSGRRRRHKKERGEKKGEKSHSKRDAILRGENIEEEDRIIIQINSDDVDDVHDGMNGITTNGNHKDDGTTNGNHKDDGDTHEYSLAADYDKEAPLEDVDTSRRVSEVNSQEVFRLKLKLAEANSIIERLEQQIERLKNRRGG